ncbi:AAA family ATPase [Streptomyces zingiberis]|uniref:Nuclease SbcCD subunit C n=1 Tax=Streptomyces zingiberis TaxID=2053010 RepID=A0ABX1C587_9ACTN|nr:AAA family ATPase [Streptomyces zingiberis]NJQ03971.1 AAA family ATPase [Streptomyces zingiberis]
MPLAGDSQQSLEREDIAPLSLLTFGDLVPEIEASMKRARLERKKEAWGNLLSLVNDLKAADESDADPAVGAPWSLASVSIEGFQGATTQLTIYLDPSPGVSIFHGPNGAGKSTISDGIRLALSGKPGWWTTIEAPNARSKSAPLWEKVPCARDSEESIAQVILRRGREELTLQTRLGKDGQPTSTQGRWRTETGDTIDVNLLSTSWPHALEGHPPVFSYADVERRVQQSNDLQRYIENLLALGGCFKYLENRVADLSESCTVSKKRIDLALRKAKSSVEQVDAEFTGRGDSAVVPALSWPQISDSIDEWLSSNNLGDSSGYLPEVNRAHLHRFERALRDTNEALERMEGDAHGVNLRYYPYLTSLHATACDVASPGRYCPVCRTDVDGWVDRLGDHVTRLHDASSVHNRVVAALSEVQKSMDCLTSVAGVLTAANESKYASSATVKAIVDLHANLSATFVRYGCQPASEVRGAFAYVSEFCNSTSWKESQKEALELSQFVRQWNRSRRRAVDDFVSVWRDEADMARKHDLWRETDKCVKELADQLRTARSAHFTLKAGSQVRQLLEDSGIVLDDFRLTTQRASVSVSDANGGKLELAMLSAGQRNAFLLAPLLATAESGPFGFLILDDPVHAFDEIRVDRLAAVLADLSKFRRVIVFTHDERLKQHLMARANNCDNWAVSRDQQSGTISLERTSQLWDVLLQDAEMVIRWAPRPSPTAYLSETQIVRGLCRQALDIAIGQCVIRYSLVADQDVAENAARLDAAMQTRARLDVAREIVQMPAGITNPIDKAMSTCGHHIGNWNKAVHGSTATKSDLSGEVNAAREACRELTKWAA